MIKGSKYTKQLRALLYMAFTAGRASDKPDTLEAFDEWITRHSDKRADLVRRFLDAAVEEGYV